MKKCPFCAEDIQDAAVACKHCGRDLSTGARAGTAVTAAPVRPPSHWLRNSLFVLVALVLLAAVGNMMNGATTPALTAEHRAAVEAAHKPHAWEPPVKVEVSGAGFVVADYEVPRNLAIPARTFGEERLLAIREALLPFGFKNFRVNVNHPPPGTGLTERVGSARFIDGGRVEWLKP